MMWHAGIGPEGPDSGVGPPTLVCEAEWCEDLSMTWIRLGHFAGYTDMKNLCQECVNHPKTLLFILERVET